MVSITISLRTNRTVSNIKDLMDVMVVMGNRFGSNGIYNNGVYWYVMGTKMADVSKCLIAHDVTSLYT